MDVLGPLRAHGKRNSLQWLGYLCRVYRFIIVSENKGRSSSLMPGNSIMTGRLTRGSRHVKGVFPEAMLPEINNLSDSFPNLITIKSRCRCFPPNDQPEEQILKRHIFEAKDNDNGLVQRLVLYKQSTLEQYAIINKRKTDCKFFIEAIYVSYRRFVGQLLVELSMSAVCPSQCVLSAFQHCFLTVVV